MPFKTTGSVVDQLVPVGGSPPSPKKKKTDATTSRLSNGKPVDRSGGVGQPVTTGQPARVYPGRGGTPASNDAGTVIKPGPFAGMTGPVGKKGTSLGPNIPGPATANLTGPATPTNKVGQDHTTVRQVQQLLRNHGYNVAVDGVEGPLTTSALENFHSSSGNATKWNSSNSSPTAHTSSSGSTTPIVSSNGLETGAAAGSNTGGPDAAASDQFKQVMAMINSKAGMIDPAAYKVNASKLGAAQAGEQYNPQISEAQRSIADALKQGKVNISDLNKWFGDASSIARTGATETHKMELQDQAAQGKTSAGVLSAFGGNAGAGGAAIAATGQTGATQLAGEAQGNDAFNGMLQGLIANQGASAKDTQAALDTKNIGDMRTSLAALVAAKANALTSNVATDRQTNISNLIGITNANNTTSAAHLNKGITLAELPTTLQAAGLANDYKGSEIDKNNATITATIQSMHNKGLIDQATYNHLVAETAAIGKKPAKSAYTSASTADIINARNYLAQAIKSGSPTTPQQITALAKTYSPWSASTPGVFANVILPALTQSGYAAGITPGMFANG